MTRDYRLYLQDILTGLESIEAFVQGMSYEQFLNDDKTASAVVRKFEIIGEASKHVPTNVKERHPDIPWKEMGRTRDRLIHVYFGVDLLAVWQAIKEEVPTLKPLIAQVVKAET